MLQYIVVGLVFGSIYALAASGLVITYVSTGVLNFAFGSFAFFIARCYYHLNVEEGWDIVPAAAVSLLVVAPGMGLLFYLLIFRHLRLASQLIKVVVTIGISVMIPAIAVVLFPNAEIFLPPGLAPPPVKIYTVFDTAVTLDQLIAYGCVVAIVVIGALVLRFTEAGLSVRAMVDSEAMTSLSGSNPSRIAAGVWVVATFLSGLAGILAAPVVGLDPNKYTLLIAAAFAAVIAARLRSLPIAVGVALLMGIAGSLAQYYLPPDSTITANVVPAIPFVFVVISLVVNLALRGRVNEEEGVGGALDRAIKPNGGTRLAASADAENHYPRFNFFFPVLIFCGIAIWATMTSSFWVGILASGGCLAIVFISYTLVTGEGGMLWLCQVTFAGIGAFTTGVLATQHDWPLVLAWLAGGVVAALFGIAIGILTIRLGNLYIALVTLTFGLLMEQLVFTLEDLAGAGGAGIVIARPDFAVSDRDFAFFVLAVFAVIAILTTNLRRSSTGLALNAVRWSENASRTMGLSVIQMKMLISGLAAFVAGIGGGLFAMSHKQAVPIEYATLIGLVWLAVLVTFGIRSNVAALIAGCIFVMSPVFIETQLHLKADWAQVPVMLFGLGAIGLATNPEGVVHQNAMQFQRLVHRIKGGQPAQVPPPAPPPMETAPDQMAGVPGQ